MPSRFIALCQHGFFSWTSTGQVKQRFQQSKTDSGGQNKTCWSHPLHQEPSFSSIRLKKKCSPKMSMQQRSFLSLHWLLLCAATTLARWSLQLEIALATRKKVQQCWKVIGIERVSNKKSLCDPSNISLACSLCQASSQHQFYSSSWDYAGKSARFVGIAFLVTSTLPSWPCWGGSWFRSRPPSW